MKKEELEAVQAKVREAVDIALSDAERAASEANNMTTSCHHNDQLAAYTNGAHAVAAAAMSFANAMNALTISMQAFMQTLDEDLNGVDTSDMAAPPSVDVNYTDQIVRGTGDKPA